jgi:hypothetical protein
VLDLTCAFQLACSKAPNSTASTTGHVSVTVRALHGRQTVCDAPPQLQGSE